MPVLRLLLPLIVTLLFAMSVDADPVAPRRVSDLVQVMSSSSTRCGGAPEFNRRFLPDGTFIPFVIPAGHVFVVTGAEVNGQGYTPNRKQPISVLHGPLQIPRIVIYDQVDALGFIGTYQNIAPVAFAAGSPLCLEVNQLTYAVLYGFLEENRR